MNTLEKFKQVHTIMLDVDGVLTNGKVIITEKGELIRSMNIKDGYAMKAALASGLKIMVITGGKSKGVVDRLKALGISEVYAGVSDKLERFEDLVDIFELDPEGILYMGDDIPDMEVMKRVGMPCCPADACPEIKEISLYISPIEGGEGCVREVIEKIMKLQGNWPMPTRSVD
ncbi:MAG: HAD-IIIA family hydrolase [Saprospiraceae bacterium]|nr:HAD-IIIA family hydrolase [Saprospiraceae bacterium]